MQYQSFDIEIYYPFDQVQDEDFRISCASVFGRQDGRTTDIIRFFNGQELGIPQPGYMETDEVDELVIYLRDSVKEGDKILTWNGLQFDFKVLARYTSMPEIVVDIALNHHIDMMFEVFCRKGFMLGLDAACVGQSVEGKGDIHGDLAPHLWQDNPQGLIDAGRPDLAEIDPDRRRKMCLEYVVSDTKISAILFEELMKKKRLNWTAKSGRANWVTYTGLSVKECLALPTPDTSWMSNPFHRSDFHRWTEKYSVLTR